VWRKAGAADGAAASAVGWSLIYVYEWDTLECQSSRAWAEGSEEPMACYRLYLTTSPRLRIEHFHDFVAENDRAAIRISGDFEAYGAMELWSGSRMVRRWERIAF
jgi:hypothetical protein